MASAWQKRQREREGEGETEVGRKAEGEGEGRREGKITENLEKCSKNSICTFWSVKENI